MPNSSISNLTPIESIGLGFDHPEDLWALIMPNRWYDKPTIMGDWNIQIKNIIFYGYREACEENQKDFPDSVLVDEIINRLDI